MTIFNKNHWTVTWTSSSSSLNYNGCLTSKHFLVLCTTLWQIYHFRLGNNNDIKKMDESFDAVLESEFEKEAWLRIFDYVLYHGTFLPM